MTGGFGDLTAEETLSQAGEFMVGGQATLANLKGLNTQEMEAAYAVGYNLYNQARWLDALKVFSFLSFHDHLDRRFHIGRGACLQMLKHNEDALRAYAIAHVLDVSDPVVAIRIAECLIALRRKSDARVVLRTVEVLAEEAAPKIGARARGLIALLDR